MHVGFNIVNVGKEGIYLNNRRPKLEDTGEAGDCNRLGTYCDFLHGTLHGLWPKQQSKGLHDALPWLMEDCESTNLT